MTCDFDSNQKKIVISQNTGTHKHKHQTFVSRLSGPFTGSVEN